VLGANGDIYVTQGGNVPGSGDTSAICGIQSVHPDGTVELLCSEVAGFALAGPNDLAFGPDGRLYFTDSGTEGDPRVDTPSPGRLFVLGPGGSGEFLMERPRLYPNGIAFDAQGRLYWTESMGHRVCRLDDAEATTFSQLSDGHVPDGMAFADDGRLFVCTTISEGVTVLAPTGEVLEEISLGEHATNCIFDGSTLYVTATKVPDLDAHQRTGTFWRVETDATVLPLLPGTL
jgi:gluconolactonase